MKVMVRVGCYCCVSPAHEVLQDRALPGALPAHHRDLRQVEAAAPGQAVLGPAGPAHGAQRILQAVDQRDQILHPAVAHSNGSAQGREGARGGLLLLPEELQRLRFESRSVPTALRSSGPHGN